MTPTAPDVVSYTYRIDGGPKQNVAAAPDGSLTIEFTPLTSGTHNINLGSMMANGGVTDGVTYTFIVG